ncbi:MAG: hypothetical protein NT116_01790 [Candidatus Parcubacteria bacterium]|nr:hypothetical protein [Candidatus Parcubacteria bacterium]
MKGETEMSRKKRKKNVMEKSSTRKIKKSNKKFYYIIIAIISLLFLAIISAWFIKVRRTLKNAKHRDVGFLIEVQLSGNYNTIFYLSKGVEPKINLIIVPKNLEQLLNANLEVQAGEYDSNGNAQMKNVTAQSLAPGGAYDHVNNVLFLYESGLEKQDKLYSYISFLHEIYHAQTTIEGLVHFNTMYEIAEAELMAHRFIGQVLNELTDGWYFTAVKQKAADFQKNYPNAIESNLQIDSKVIVGDLEAKMQDKIGNAGHFQYLFDIMDQWSKLKYGNSAQAEIFLKNFYLTTLGQNAK